MRGFIIMIFVFLMLISFVVAEEIYVDESKINNVDDFELIIDQWDKEMIILNYFINQKELERITLDMKTAKSFYESGNSELYRAYLVRTKERIVNLPQY